MDVFPAAIPLSGLLVVVAGEGAAAEAKARLFERSPARLVRVGGAEAASPDAYAGARLAFIALSADEAPAAAKAARAAGALVNVVDRPALCDFHTPALVDRGAVVAAIMTGGGAPVLAAELRSEIEARWPAGLGVLAEVIAALTPEVRAALPGATARRAWLRREMIDGPAAALALAGDREGAMAEARRRLASPPPATGGAAWLAPSPSPDLLTLRDLRALTRADILVLAGDGAPAVAAFARRDAQRFGAAEVSAARLAAWAAEGASVVCIGPCEAFEALGPPAPLNTRG